MSRHRNIRNLDYDEEYDEAWDESVYGRSVDDCDTCISPTAEQYLYKRSGQGNFSNFFQHQDEIVEEDVEAQPEVQKSSKPKLSDEEEARMLSLLDQIRSVLGGTVSEDQMRTEVLKNKFDLEKSIDKLLNKAQPDFQAYPVQAQHNGRADKPVVTTPQRPQQQKMKPNKTKSSTAKGHSSGASRQVTVVDSSSATRVVRGFDVTPSATEKKTHNSSAFEDSVVNGKTASPQVSTPKPVKLPTKQRDASVDVRALYSASQGAAGKELINLVVVGHVDAGKSTLTGHLLYQQGQVSQRTMHKYERESQKCGKQSFMYAWVMDDTEEERSRGVTVDVAERTFETERKIVHILDAPGHKDFIPNMISGAARADVALLVVDASTGEFEAGFESNGQTREHAMLIKSLGVSEVTVAVNKLDVVQWSQQRFNEICSTLTVFLKSVGFRSSEVTYVPCAGLSGENLVKPPSEPQLKAWYSGPTILNAIDNMKSPSRDVDQPARFSISDVFKGGSSNMCVAGKLHTGYIQSGDRLLLLPHTSAITIKDVSCNSAPGSIFAGDSGTLTVSGVEPDELSVGSFLCDPAKPMRRTTTLQARIVVFNVIIPIIKGTQAEFHLQSVCEPATVRKLISQINKSTGEVMKNRPRVLARQTAGVIELELSRPICVETYKDCKDLGRFMLRQQGNTIAAGLITEQW
ncbi:HBS1-like protein isoform X2 [Hyalella azteca]|uniref:HBS1-like protein isoform X2 n=1 Tax=Hyalella azteca TaxID=294128 RepID=A0A979FFN2_HYAAZ|nr:HBS1-like protein isoform X2 [Hyalella azteca]